MNRINQEEKMLAPCGINCTYCYAHHRKKKPCPGCRLGDEGKPEHCRKCRIKECAAGRTVAFCSECPDYPCLVIKRLDKSYRQRYRESLIRNRQIIKEKGLIYYLDLEKRRLQCPECEGILNIHDKHCSLCGKAFAVDEL